MNPVLKPLPPLGRFLMALVFVYAGIRKLGTVAATAATMEKHGIPHSDMLVWGAIALELAGGLALMLGFLARLAALALFFYTLVLAVIFHPYWTFTGDAFGLERASFYGHLSMMGGMLFVVAFGAGPYSIDALIFGRRGSAAPE
ncbi:MAG TPA: DoxX family protein [Bryobacteraceae bacterium]|nr:DoxX family protein [Bryobacteraceae bacterium]